jgi:hypothetical protein
MKDKNCVDPKMAAYCQAIRDLEGKFHGLELHHVLRDYNKVVDVLTKATSSRSLVPHGVFTSDQHQPSVREEGEKPPEESEPEVMAIDQPPKVNLEDPDWRFPIREWLVEGKLPPTPTRQKPGELPNEQKLSLSSTVNSTSVGLLAYSCGASSGIKAASCCKKFMPALAITTPIREHFSGKLSDKVSTGPQRSPTQRTSCGAGRGASLLTVYIRVKVQVDFQADKSPIVVKGPFFPRVVNPRY